MGSAKNRGNSDDTKKAIGSQPQGMGIAMPLVFLSASFSGVW